MLRCIVRENNWKTQKVKVHQLRVYDVIEKVDPPLFALMKSVAPHHKEQDLLNHFASSRVMLVCFVCKSCSPRCWSFQTPPLCLCFPPPDFERVPGFCISGQVFPILFSHISLIVDQQCLPVHLIIRWYVVYF